MDADEDGVMDRPQAVRGGQRDVAGRGGLTGVS